MMTDKPILESTEKGVAVIKEEYLWHSAKNEIEPAAKVAKIDENVSENTNKKRQRGQNRQRYAKNRAKVERCNLLCKSLINVKPEDEMPVCPNEKCRMSHDVQAFLTSKPPDIGEECLLFIKHGVCPWGVTCRFGSKHITENGRNIAINNSTSPDKLFHGYISNELQVKLRKKTYDFSLSDKVVLEVCQNQKNGDDGDSKQTETADKTNISIASPDKEKIGACVEGVINLREKKVIDWKNKLYLSPLTTVGNLPFRRICKEWGADVTCGEMALATSILQGAPQEWALLNRHPSEDLFGVQICGNNSDLLTRCVQLINETSNIDFIDLNLGCPLEQIYRNGGGSGLLLRQNKLAKIIECMTRISSVPITVKTRAGVYDNKLVAHKQVPIYSAAGVSLITVHGRTREQRYTRHADWGYIEQCAKAASPTPLFGNGDILTVSDYDTFMATCPSISGVMIGRGALYKPWIFKELKERRDWDITSSERLDILRKFVNYGFEHWGSDTRGVETTRRFLLEWLSFLYRYIPLGLLEQPPQRINERPPRYIGRNDLETLMASCNSNDWVKISEMLCGPVPEGFHFVPKHKANAWSSG